MSYKYLLILFILCILVLWVLIAWNSIEFNKNHCTTIKINKKYEEPLNINFNGASYHHKRCNNEESNKLAHDYIRYRGWYHCPHAHWRVDMQAIDPYPNKTILVTGCNKGFDAVALHILFDNNSNKLNKEFSLVDWWNQLKSVGANRCGACQQCKELNVKKKEFHLNNIYNNIRPTIYCIEAALGTVKQLKKVSHTLNYTSQNGFNVIHKAFVGTATLKHVHFPNVDSGNEAAFIGKSKNSVVVPAITIDEWAYKNNITILDILSLDAEGHDAKILYGASRLLSNNRIRLLEFETHRVGEWLSMRLKDLIDFLDTVGMVCFLAGRDLLWRITGCYDKIYDSHKSKMWGNVVCAPLYDPIGKPVLPILEKYEVVLQKNGTFKRYQI